MKYSEWRAKQKRGETFTLPVAGFDVTVRRVSLRMLALNGDIPQTLHPFTDELLSKGQDIQISMDELARFGELIALVIKACVMDPPVISRDALEDEYKKFISVDVVEGEPRARTSYEDWVDGFIGTHLCVEDLPDEDRVFLFNWANGGAAQLTKFRGEQSGDVDALQHSNGDGTATEPNLTNIR